eukprot:3915047-Pleurochrysis_carterae.AAC.1
MLGPAILRLEAPSAGPTSAYSSNGSSKESSRDYKTPVRQRHCRRSYENIRGETGERMAASLGERGSGHLAAWGVRAGNVIHLRDVLRKQASQTSGEMEAVNRRILVAEPLCECESDARAIARADAGAAGAPGERVQVQCEWVSKRKRLRVGRRRRA